MGIVLELLLLFAMFKVFTSLPNDEQQQQQQQQSGEDSKCNRQYNNITTTHKTLFMPKPTIINSLNITFNSIEFHISDFELLFQKGIITENQAILIWESLLNSKTERNLELLEYKKLLTTQQQQNQQHTYYTPSNNNNELHSKYFQYFALLFNTNEFKFKTIYIYIVNIIFYFFTKQLQIYPSINLVSLTAMLIFHIINAFGFYNDKFYFTSCICLCAFISCLYFIYINIALICGEKDVDCSIFYVKHFKTKTHFYIKITICVFLLVLLLYITSIALRFHLNYIIGFFLMEKLREMMKNFYNKTSISFIQPINNFISVIFGFVVLVFSNVFYFYNIQFSYELNSFLFVNNVISFYYISFIDYYVYIQRSGFSAAFMKCQQIGNSRECDNMFEEIKKELNYDKLYRRNDVYKDNYILDIFVLALCLQFLFLGFICGVYFYIIVSFIFLYTLHKTNLLFTNIKVSRVVSGLTVLVYLIVISNIKNVSYSYINEIIALYDNKCIDALMQLIKLILYITLGVCVYFNKDYISLFNLYDYSSYKYLIKEITCPDDKNIKQIIESIYNKGYVLYEIVDYDFISTIATVHSVLDKINDGGSNISGPYIQTLLFKESNNAYCLLLIVDYLIHYFTIFVLDDVFHSNQNAFFIGVYAFHKVCVYCKMLLLYFEYSKTQTQKNVYLVLNLIFLERMFYYLEMDSIDKLMLACFKLGKFFITFFELKSQTFKTIFLLGFMWVYYNSRYEPSIFGFHFFLTSILGKTSIKILKVKKVIAIIYGAITIACVLIISEIKYESIKWIVVSFQYFCIQCCGVDVIGYIERILLAKGSRNDCIEIKLIYIIKFILHNIRKICMS